YAHRLKDLYKKADPLNRYPEHDKINQFLKGLRRDIGILVQTQNPMSLNQAIESAKNIERAFAQNGSFALASGDMNQELRKIKATMDLVTIKEKSIILKIQMKKKKYLISKTKMF